MNAAEERGGEAVAASVEAEKYHLVLGLDESALNDTEALKRAVKTSAIKWHPDHFERSKLGKGVLLGSPLTLHFFTEQFVLSQLAHDQWTKQSLTDYGDAELDEWNSLIKLAIEDLQEEWESTKVAIEASTAAGVRLRNAVYAYCKNVSRLEGTVSGLEGTVSGLEKTVSGLEKTVQELSHGVAAFIQGRNDFYTQAEAKAEATRQKTLALLSTMKSLFEMEGLPFPEDLSKLLSEAETDTPIQRADMNNVDAAVLATTPQKNFTPMNKRSQTPPPAVGHFRNTSSANDLLARRRTLTA